MRIAVISDIHANLAAFQAVLKDMGTVDETWCLGDVVGYGPDPNECIELLCKQEPHVCIAGNNDWAALGRLETADFNADAEFAALWTRDHLTPANRAYLESRPERVPKGDFTLVHGSPRDPIWEYLLSAGAARDNFPLFATPYCFVGHSHIPIIFRQGLAINDSPEIQAGTVSVPINLDQRRLIINPGSVGQPRDGNPDASYVILDTEAHTVTYRRVPYAIEETQERMRQAGLPPRLIARLSFGW